MKFRHLPFLILLSVFLATPAQTIFAQDETQNQSTEADMTVGFSSTFGGVYYKDPLGTQLSGRLIPFEGNIDLNSYKLGVNDLISINIEANQPIFLRGLLVNPQGEVVLPMMGAVKLEGLTIPQAEEQISEIASRQLRDPIVDITIEYPRPNIIHISGGVPHPGKYVIPSQSRLDQAIFNSLTDGNRNMGRSTVNSSQILTGNYSLRNITILHTDSTITTADLVSYFRTGDLSSNPVLKNGDTINITTLKREAAKVSISGAVKSAYEIEYREGDTPSLLLEIAGGFDVIADNSRLHVYRQTEDGTYTVEVLFGEWDSFQLQPNDRIIALQGEYFDPSASAWVNGEVKIPGNFPIKSGQTTAFELLKLAGGMTNDALPSAAYLMRGGERNRIPNEFNTEIMKRTSDQVLQGLEYLDSETQLSRNRVYIDLTDEEQMQELKLLDGDRLYIPKDSKTIFVFGQVNNPGYFPFTNSEKSVRDYIVDAGGFALSADLDRIFILKAGNSTWYRVGDTTLESGDRIYVDRQPVEELNALRAYEIQKQQLRNQRTQLIMTGITTITGIITTLVAIGAL
ncbi:MAG: hypothetical protein ED557_11640 [Balneola sp.]|nr:MAG: hypothetical protein ED557_11640 [Balneola sp.]